MDAANFVFEHPRGPILGWFTREGLKELVLPVAGRSRAPVLHSAFNDRRARELRALLRDYFAGVRQDFADVPLDFSGATPFRRAVWETARNVSWGTTSTYGELARLVDNPRGARAVGQALGANPLPIIVPCHRFLAHDGKAGGFSSGLEWKRELLAAEGVALEAA